MVGVLMAAGMGKRLLPLTAERSKAMVEVAGFPLIDHGVAFLRAAGISRIAVVGGYRFPQLAEHVQSLAPDAVLVENPDFELQNGTSLLRLLEKVSGDLLVCDIDYIRSLDQARAVGRTFSETTLFVSMGLVEDPDVMRVGVSSEGEIMAMSKRLEEYQATSSGMFFVPAHRNADLKAAMEAAIAEKGPKDARLEDGLMALVDRGVPLVAHDVGPRFWAEIDTPEERDAAEAFIAAHRPDLALPPAMR